MKCLLFVVCIAVLCGVSWCANGCTKGKMCDCIEGNFTIDLGKLGSELEGRNISLIDGGDPDYQKYTFLLSLCKPIVCNFTKGASGEKKAAACQYNPNQNAFTKLGEQSTINWDVDPSDEADFYIMYTGGDTVEDDHSGRRTKVQFKIDNTVKNSVVVFDQEIKKDKDKDDNPYHTYVFKVTVNSKDLSSGGSIAGIAGLVIILLIIIGIAAYCIIGSVVMFKVKGARGAEVIPNYSFWKELPIYIKDGFLFTISPCRRKFGKGYQSL